MNICQWESCVLSKCRICSQLVKNNNNTLTIQSVVCNCFNTTRVKLAVSRVDSSRWKPSKVTKDTNISRQGFGLRILECTKYFVHRLPWERKNYYIALLMHLKEEIVKKQPQMKKEKGALSTRHCTISQVNHNDGKTTWIALWIAFAPTLFYRSGPPTATSCLQTSKERSKKRDLTPMKNWYQKLRRILRPKINCSTKKVLNC